MKIIITLISFLFIVFGNKQECRRCRAQAVSIGILNLGFLKYPLFGITMISLFVVSQLLINRFIKEEKRR